MARVIVRIEDRKKRGRRAEPVGHVVVNGIFARDEALHSICLGGCSDESKLGIVH